MEDNGTIRKFETGATRDTSQNKNDYEGFLSPLVIEAFGDYMSENRKQSDGSIRDSDNWQKGIPPMVYMKSGWRHFVQWWKLHRGLACKDERGRPVDMHHAICGLLFNAMGYFHEYLKAEALKSAGSAGNALDKIAAQVRAEKERDAFDKSLMPKPPEYPRYFESQGDVFVLTSPSIGRRYDSVGHWGVSNWSLRNLEGLSVTEEIHASEAVCRGLPNQISEWPQQLRDDYYSHNNGLYATPMPGTPVECQLERASVLND
jgi:hypothetical protein